MHDSPWAKWGMFITPNTRASPMESKAHMPPVRMVLASWDWPAFQPISTVSITVSRSTNQAADRVLRLRRTVFQMGTGWLSDACIVPFPLQ